MCFRAWTVHRPSSKTREHKAVRRTRNAHLPLLNYICTCEHTCKHTSDSCLLSRMLNCPLAREHRGSRALKQTVPRVKDIQTHVQVGSGDVPGRAWPGHITDRSEALPVQELQQSFWVLKWKEALKSSMKFTGFLFVLKSKRHLWAYIFSWILKSIHSAWLTWLDSVNTLSYVWLICGKTWLMSWISAENIYFLRRWEWGWFRLGGWTWGGERSHTAPTCGWTKHNFPRPDSSGLHLGDTLKTLLPLSTTQTPKQMTAIERNRTHHHYV